MPQERGPLQGQLFTHPHSHSSPLLCLHWSTASPLVYSIFITSPSAVGDKLRLDSGPNVCSANVTGQISVTPANIFKLLPRGYRGRWVVLEMIGLTLRDANHSWKGDSTFGCYLPGESRGKKNTSELNYGAFWSLMQTGCGKCVWAPHISEWYWREKHVAESSHAISASTLWPFCAFQLTYKLSFHERLGEERLTAPLLSCACARKRWIFEATPGCVYADNIWQAWNEASEDMKAGSVCQNQEIINPHHPPRGPIWKSLVQNNVLLLLLVWKIITAIILRRITKTIREDLNYLLCS